MATTDRPETVSEDVATFFESRRLISPIRNNYRRISTATISPPSSRSVSSSSSSPSQSVSSEHFDASFVNKEVDEVEIPAVLHSIETYMYIGFTYNRAKILWDRYVTVVDEAFDGDFFDYVKWHFEDTRVPDATTSTDDWNACMIAMGVNEKLRTDILLPEFDDIRFTATCKYWVLDAMEICFRALKGMDDRLRMEGVRLKQLQKMAGSISESPPLPSSTSYELTANLLSSEPQATTLSPSCGVMSGQPTPLVATTYAAPSNLQHHTMLWRAGDRVLSEAFYNKETQKIKLLAISTIPGDFSGQKKLTYWTPQRETADRYAQWTKHKVDISEIVIIQVAVPESLIKALAVKYLWYRETQMPREEWRKFVYHSRRAEDLPPELHYIEQCDLLIGHIATGVNRKFESLDHWNQIKDEDVLTIRIAGEQKMAIQWAFNTYKARDGFVEQCRGKVWLHYLGTFKVSPSESNS
ncbi:MAG: hypothetical protein M1839_001676 [Geoglossum umbratile]|nr:MAG: hypothetical protein M1839_001676 [Geoglossum umbratile]